MTCTATDDIPCDFGEFFAQRRQLSAEAASSLIGELLVSYEPGPIARSHQAKSRALAKPPVETKSRAAARRVSRAA